MAPEAVAETLLVSSLTFLPGPTQAPWCLRTEHGNPTRVEITPDSLPRAQGSQDRIST